jgi:hypothetical protein
MGLVLVAAVACGATEPSAQPIQQIVKVYVDADGTILADGKPVTLEELRRIFADLKARDGAVMYDRAGEEGSEPPPHAMDVISAITEAQLPTLMEDQPGVSIQLQKR